MSGPAVKQNLLWHIRAVLDNRDRWPNDSDRAYRMLVRHVMMAAYGMNTRAPEDFRDRD
jgi:hypothetical protein